MSEIFMRHFSFRFEHPAKEEPSWKTIVERWYQLDPFAYGLAQAFTVWKPALGAMPERIFLASPHASNETDLQFVHSGALSPAKFVHTLSNIRCSPLCQVMNWAGPVICIQKDPSTQMHALREAIAYLESQASKPSESGPVWVMAAYKPDPQQPAYLAQAYVLERSDSRPSPAAMTVSKVSDLSQMGPLQTDEELQKWLEFRGGVFALPGRYQIDKTADVLSKEAKE